MNLLRRKDSGRKRGFFASFRLAWRIFIGTFALLKRHPKLVLPLPPVFVMVFLISYSLDRMVIISTPVFILFITAIFFSAYALMFSFAISTQMLKQIHTGQAVSVVNAISSPGTVRMIRRVLALSIVWYGLVLVLVLIEMVIKSILDRFGDGLGNTVIRAVFGTVATALRMSAFMMVAIMVFEDIDLRLAFGRFRGIVQNNSYGALGGLVLTSATTVVIGLIIYIIDGAVVMLPVLAVGWLVAIYLEQMFVTGLYLYSAAPDSPVVEILLGDFVGRELPKPKLVEQPLF